MAENYDLIFAQNAAQAYSWSDTEYLQGWGVIGNMPPTAVQFDALFAGLDRKAKDLNGRLETVEKESVSGERKKGSVYNVKDIAYYHSLPVGWYLECKVPGITSTGELDLPEPVTVGSTVIDGTVTWRLGKISAAGAFTVSEDAPTDDGVIWIKPMD